MSTPIIHTMKIPPAAFFIALFVLLIFTWAPFSAHAGTTIKSTASLSLTNGLVGYWNFDEGQGNTAHDYSGQGNTGTLTNGPTWTQSNTGLGDALNFDGVNDYVNAGNPASLTDITVKTISFWTKLSTYKGTDGGTGSHWVNKNDVMFVASDADSSRHIFAQNFSTTNGRWSIAQSAIPLNIWTHIAIIYDRSSTSNKPVWYVNGVSKTVTEYNTPVGSASSDSGNLYVGNAIGSARAVNGSIDEVRIYNRALSQAEITRLYNLKKPKIRAPDTTGLVGYWNFNEGIGTSAKDTSGKKNTGTLTNMASPATAASGWTSRGRYGNGLNFDGVDDLVAIGNGIDKTFTGANAKFSITTWINPTAAMTNNDIVVKAADSNCSENQREFYFQLGTNSKLVFTWDNDLLGNTFQTVTGSTQINTTGRWYYVTVIYDGTQALDSRVSLYVNGVKEIASVSDTGSPSAIQSGTALLGIGERATSSGTNCATSKGFNGSIDEVRIYNRALTADQVSKLYKSGVATYNVPLVNNTLSSGLVGWWTFDGKDTFPTASTPTTLDRSGNNNTGTLTNGPKPVAGKIGQALNFDGVNDYVAITNAAITAAPFSISVWFRNTSACSASCDFVSFGNTSDSNQFVNIQLFNAKAQFTLRKVSSATQNTAASSLSYNDGKWHHAVGVARASNDVQLYIDGVSVGTGLTDPGGFPTLQNTTIGALRRTTTSNYFPGSIDDVRIYNRALSAVEVNRLYNGGRTGN